jgi:DNA-binding PadR family transcriptional regulator
MKVLVFATWENPKSDEGLKKYYEHGEKHRKYLTERREKYNVKSNSWSDGTGKMYWLQEFESYEDYAKFMDDEELQKIMIHGWRNVKNGKMKVLRESISAPP